MHEFGIAQALLETVTNRLAETRATRVASIRLHIGILAGVEQEALTFAFSALAEDTPAEGAQLLIEKIPLRCYCSTCDAIFEAKPFAYKCPACGAPSADIRTGKEMNLIAMEVT
jgi:hydrogenase nickel incorporation protein HypA/HybF